MMIYCNEREICKLSGGNSHIYSYCRRYYRKTKSQSQFFPQYCATPPLTSLHWLYMQLHWLFNVSPVVLKQSILLMLKDSIGIISLCVCQWLELWDSSARRKRCRMIEKMEGRTELVDASLRCQEEQEAVLTTWRRNSQMSACWT